MENQYNKVNCINGTSRNFFRGNLDTEALFKLYDQIGRFSLLEYIDNNPEDNGGCTESCEMFDMD